MSRARLASFLFACLAASSLAGCAHRDAPAAGSGAVGTLHGIVVDTGIRPLAGVRLSTQGPAGPVVANSTAAGAFAFPPLPFGAYAVTAHRAGFLDVRATAQLDGTDRPLRIQMEPTAGGAPFVVASLFRGFLECSVTTLGATAAVCAIPNAGSDGVALATCGLGLPTPCTRPDNVTQDSNYATIPVDGQPRWAQHEAVWQATQSLGDQLHLFVNVQGTGANATVSAPLNDTAGPSPLLMTENQTVLAAGGAGPASPLDLAVFAGGLTQSGSQVCTPEAPLFGTTCFWDTGATLEQEFRIYTHLFYGFTPPPGYRFSRDGDPVPPPS